MMMMDDGCWWWWWWWSSSSWRRSKSWWWWWWWCWWHLELCSLDLSASVTLFSILICQTVKQSNNQTVKQSNNHISQLTCRRRSSNWLHCYNILSFLGYFGLGWNFAPAQPNSKDKQDGDQEHGHLSIWKCFSRLTCLDSAFARRIHFLPKTSLSIRAFPLQWIPMRANQCWVTEGGRVGKWGVR